MLGRHALEGISKTTMTMVYIFWNELRRAAINKEKYSSTLSKYSGLSEVFRYFYIHCEYRYFQEPKWSLNKY
jgi:hypothetical protein